MDLITETKTLRKQLDSLIQTLEPRASSSHLFLALTSLQRSRMFLGDALKTLAEPGTEAYPESYNPSSDYIAPTLDKAEEKFDIGNLPVIEFIKKCRVIIREFLGVPFWTYRLPDDVAKKDFHLYSAASFMALTDAKNWLGMELSSIRDMQEIRERTKNIDQNKARVVGPGKEMIEDLSIEGPEEEKKPEENPTGDHPKTQGGTDGKSDLYISSFDR